MSSESCVSAALLPPEQMKRPVLRHTAKQQEHSLRQKQAMVHRAPTTTISLTRTGANGREQEQLLLPSVATEMLRQMHLIQRLVLCNRNLQTTTEAFLMMMAQKLKSNSSLHEQA